MVDTPEVEDQIRRQQELDAVAEEVGEEGDQATAVENWQRVGIELNDYLARLREEFAPSMDAVGQEGLRRIDNDLRAIEDDNRAVSSAAASESLIRVFHNMEAWRAQMQQAASSAEVNDDRRQGYFDSQKTFMKSCEKLYPGIAAATTINLAGSEIYAIQRELSMVDLGQIKTNINKLPDHGVPSLEDAAETIDQQRETDPEAAAKSLQTIMSAVSEGVRQTMQAGIKAEDQVYLDDCVQVLFKLQLLIDQLHVDALKESAGVEQDKVGTVGEEAVSSTESDRGEADTENKESGEHEALIRRIDAKWKQYFEADLGTIEAFLADPVMRTIDLDEFDAESAEQFEVDLTKIWGDYQSDHEGMKRIDEYKIDIGRIMERDLEISVS